MTNYLKPSPHVPYSVIFPKAHKLVVRVITNSSHVFCLPSIRKVLAECAEELTLKLVKESAHSGTNAPYLDLTQIDVDAERRLKVYLDHQWEEKVRICSELARMAYPFVFEFVREHLIVNEQSPNDLSFEDIAVLTMVIVEKSEVTNKGKGDWLRSRSKIKHNLGHWFSVKETI